MTFDYAPMTPATADLGDLGDLVKRLFQAEESLARIAAQLDQAKAIVSALSERDIPELMGKINVKDFTTSDGIRVRVKEVVRASIPLSNRVAACAWLEDHGQGGLIKRKILVDFPKDMAAKAKTVIALLQKKGFENVSEDMNVHPMTLSAFIRGQLELGEDIPMALFGASQFQKAMIDTKSHA